MMDRSVPPTRPLPCGESRADGPEDTSPDPAEACPPWDDLDQLVHQVIGCLSAVRTYAAGARKALLHGRHDQVDQGLGRIDEQVLRAYGLLRTARGGGADRDHG